MVSHKPKSVGREPLLPSAKHRLRYDPFAIVKKQAVRKAALKSTAKPVSGPGSGAQALNSSWHMPPLPTVAAASPALRQPQPHKMPSMVIDMTNLSIGASRPASRRAHPAAAVGRAPVEDSEMDIVKDLDAKPLLSGEESSAYTDSGSDSNSDSDLHESDLDEHLLEDGLDDVLVSGNRDKNSISNRAPYRFRTVKRVGSVVRQWPVHRTKHTYDYEPEDIRPAEAHRMMQSILTDRHNNITRRMLLRGDSPNNSYSIQTAMRRSDVLYRSAISWPRIDIYRYYAHIQLNRHLAIGIDPMRSLRDPYASIDLEEPGEEWDQKQVHLLYGDDSSAMENVDDSGYVCGFTASTDRSEISDTRRNGGMGIVIKRSEDDEGTAGPASPGDNVKMLTHLKLEHPELAEPRGKQLHLLDMFDGRNSDLLQRYYQPVIDLTRAQVIGQALKTMALPAGSCPPQLSKLTSSSVAEEAVSGVCRVWDMLSECWQHQMDLVFASNEKRRLGGLPYPGSNKTGWIGVLEAAAVADIPPQVIARCYHRLVRLCDVNPDTHVSDMCQLSIGRITMSNRRYVPKDKADV